MKKSYLMLKTILVSLFVSLKISAGTVTFVTHGMDSNARTWVRDMTLAMHTYQRNLGFEADVFYLELPRQNSVEVLPEFVVQQLTFTSTNPDRNIIIAFDWSYYAESDFFGATVEYDTIDIAPLPAYFLRKHEPLPGLPNPLVESPLHLVGHSRGGSLLCIRHRNRVYPDRLNLVHDRGNGRSIDSSEAFYSGGTRWIFNGLPQERSDAAGVRRPGRHQPGLSLAVAAAGQVRQSAGGIRGDPARHPDGQGGGIQIGVSGRSKAGDPAGLFSG